MKYLFRNDNLLAQLIYRIVLVCVCITGVIFAFVDNAEVPARVFLFYTNWSVFLALGVAIATLCETALKMKKGEKTGHSTLCPTIKLMANITIIATFIVGGFVLKQFFDTTGHAFRHFFIPVLTVLDTVLFDKDHQYKIYDPFISVSYSLVYWIIVIVRFCIKRGGGAIPEAEWANYYPYGFTNIDNGHSLGGLIGLLAGIMVGLIAIGFAYWAIDKLTKQNNKITFTK